MLCIRYIVSLSLSIYIYIFLKKILYTLGTLVVQTSEMMFLLKRLEFFVKHFLVAKSKSWIA